VYQAAVIGTVTDGQDSELPEGLTVTIKLEDTSLADAPAVVISEIRIENPGQFPIPFAVVYDPELIEESNTYTMNVRIEDAAGNLQYINTTVSQVITNGMPRLVEIIVDNVGG
jgi:putative lipoprotein